MISSCNQQILKNARVISMENDGVAFESEGIRNESKADGNKTILMYLHLKIVLPQMMREEQLDVMEKCSDKTWYISTKFTQG